jgi:hypothetical protein
MLQPLWSALNPTPEELKPLDYLENRADQRAEHAKARGSGMEEAKKAAIIRRLAKAIRDGFYGFKTTDNKSAILVSRNQHEGKEGRPFQCTFCWLNAEGAIEAMEWDERFPSLAMVVLFLWENKIIIPQERFELKLRIWPTDVNAGDGPEDVSSSFIASARLRKHPVTLNRDTVVSTDITPAELKLVPSYPAAKAGDRESAMRLMEEVVDEEFVESLRSRVPSGAVFVFPHAEESKGKNAIPGVFASLCAKVTGGTVDDEIVQDNKTYHTGASMVERIAYGSEYSGEIVPGANYAMIDDNLTSGGTLADLASFIIEGGGNVVATIVLTTSEKLGKLDNRKKLVRILKERFGDVLESELGIHAEALTDSELHYLVGLRSADALRNRIAKTRQERADRLRSKGSGDMGSAEEAGPLKSSRFQQALASAGPIESLTIPQLRDAEDPAFLKKGVRRMELVTPMLKRVYASTVEYATKSSKYATNKVIYAQKVLFRDFYVIARDKQIPMASAIRYAIEHGDVTCRCSCPSQKYHYSFVQNELGTLYGLPRENRYPGITNPSLRSVYCKHLSRVMEQIFANENVLVEKFSGVYNRQDLPGVPVEKSSQPEPEPEVPKERVKVSDV